MGICHLEFIFFLKVYLTIKQTRGRVREKQHIEIYQHTCLHGYQYGLGQAL